MIIVTKKVIIDTDIGSDIDDAMALALAIKSFEIEIKGITTVYGDVDLRARLAKKLLDLGDCPNIGVYAGIEKPLLRERDVWMAGHEGDGVLDEGEIISYESQHAVDFIIDTIMNAPGEVTLIPIGPLTNIATAIIREPRIADNVKEIILMGGVTRLSKDSLHLPITEHNIHSDPEAASVVFNSSAAITMVGVDVTHQVTIGREHQRQLENSTPLNNAIAKQMEKWFDFIEEDITLMHDPLTVSLLLDRNLVKTAKGTISVIYDHRHPTGQTLFTLDQAGNVEVCLEVESEQFLNLLMHKLLDGNN